MSVPAFAAAPTWCESGFLDSNQNPPVCFDYYEPADQYCSPTNCFYGYQLSDCDNLPGGNTWLTCIGSTPPSVQWGEFADFSDINADVAIMAALVIGFALVVLGANKARVFVKKA